MKKKKKKSFRIFPLSVVDGTLGVWGWVQKWGLLG